MKWPGVYMSSPSRSPLPPPSPPAPSRSSQSTRSESLSHASNLGWWSVSPLIVYMFRCCSLETSHPRLLPQSLFNLTICQWVVTLRLPWQRKWILRNTHCQNLICSASKSHILDSNLNHESLNTMLSSFKALVLSANPYTRVVMIFFRKSVSITLKMLKITG